MNKKWYKLIFKQLQPIHIGAGNYGVINETKVFIPGITMWGALTNSYFREKNIYDKELFENITCFFPMVDNQILEPKFKDGEFYLRDKSEKKFRKDFTATYLSTAINPSSLSAKDESLHEIDIVLPRDKKNEKNLYWIGYLNIEDKSKVPEEIIVGGDSRYGFGKMISEKEKIEEENYPYEVKKGIYQDENYPKNEPITNYVKFKNQKFEGKMELLAEFDFTNNLPKIENSATAGFFIVPGSKVPE